METLEELERQLAEKEQQLEALKAEDPFWYYEPTDGKITPEMKAFLQEYLRDEDIPASVDGQVNIHLSSAEILGGSGGNQSGKSSSGCIEDFIQATGEVPLSMQKWYPKEKLPTTWPQKLRVVGVSNDQMLNTVLPTYQQWVPRQYLLNGSWADSFSAEKKTLYLHKNRQVISWIEFKTNQQDVETFQGPPLDKVTYDEEPRHAIWKENLMRFVTADRLRIQINWTPTKGLTWLTDLIEDEGHKRGCSVELFKLCTVSNPKANLKAVRGILAEVTDYKELKMRLLGEFISLSGLVYGKIFDKNRHVIEPFKLNWNDYLVYRGLDPHLVKPTACCEVAVDREDIEYVAGCYLKDAEVEDIKKDLAARAIERNYRLGPARCDKSANSTIKVLGDRNVFLELQRGANAVPALTESQKFTGSIHAGVDTIKQKLKDGKLFIFDLPENKPLIHAFKTLERDTYANEDVKGEKDKIREGPHDLHACLRYIHQHPVRWQPPMDNVPEPEPMERYI